MKININIVNKKNQINIYCDNYLIISGNKNKTGATLIANNYLLRKNNLFLNQIKFNKVLISSIEHHKKNLLIEKNSK